MRFLKLALLLFLVLPTVASASTKCQERTVNGHIAKMCMENPGMFKHWTFSLEVDGETIFSLVDDYSENVSLTHTIPKGLALEFPLSRQGKESISITGGCVPVTNAEGTETSRKCNFTWGDVQIVKDVEFHH